MINLKQLRDNPKHFEDAAKAKGITIDTRHILDIDAKHKELSLAIQTIREERNLLIDAMKGGKPTPDQIAKGKELKERLEKEENAFNAVDAELEEMLLKIPNPAKKDVKVGKDESENDVIKTVGKPKKFNFTPRDHVEIGKILDIIDLDSAVKVSGARFGYLKNEGVLLEFALVQLALETLVKEGFTPVIPPVLIKSKTMRGLGYMEHGGEEDMFVIPKDDFYLVGTAEHALVPMHADEVLKMEDLPKRYVGFSSAFRREAGSYGKDTKGLIRVHQFDKVEMVSFVPQGKDDEEHEYLLSLEEKFFQMLDIPYQVIKMCTGDLGFPTARKYDVEAWIPSQEKYREVTSASTITDFQARRFNIKYTSNGEKHLANILNGTAFAIGRTIVAILENNQLEDGSVVVPEVLQKYVGKKVIKPRS